MIGNMPLNRGMSELHEVEINKRGLRKLQAILANNEFEVPLTPAQLARRWQLHPITLRRWVREGKLRCTRIGRGVRFSIAEVERIEREGTV